MNKKPRIEDRAEEQGFPITDKAILKALEKMPFSSICQIATMTVIPPPTVFRRFRKLLHFVLKRLHWVPAHSRIFKSGSDHHVKGVPAVA
jgi:hypothetical protein